MIGCGAGDNGRARRSARGSREGRVWRGFAAEEIDVLEDSEGCLVAFSRNVLAGDVLQLPLKCFPKLGILTGEIAMGT